MAVRRIGAFMAECKDPDHGVMKTFAVGVPIGVGVRLPRTPPVFKPKRTWSLLEQEDPLLYLHANEIVPISRRRANYPSAKLHQAAVEKTLELQELKGQVISFDEDEAHRVFKDSLIVASLGALEKGVKRDGTI